MVAQQEITKPQDRAPPAEADDPELADRALEKARERLGEEFVRKNRLDREILARPHPAWMALSDLDAAEREGRVRTSRHAYFLHLLKTARGP